MQHRLTTILLMLCLSGLTSCSQESNNILFEKSGYEFPYQIDKPDQSWKLPGSLVEISGLGFIDAHRLACVQDEKGILFIFNLKAGKIESEIEFGDDGDYEGIEIVENDAWVLKSNGTLYKVTDYMEKAEPAVKKYKTALSRKNDAEGLAYDPINNNLLIACKGQPFIAEDRGREYRAIYSFNPETRLLDNNPFLLIHMDSLRYYKNYNAMTRLGIDILAYLNPAQGDVTFAPSGLAIHPATGDIFILGSVGKLLLVFSSEGEMRAMISLDQKIFPKPEGICFSPDGILYIASEGKGRSGTILKFNTIR